MKPVTITIEVDPAALSRHTDVRLAMLWHLAQANPVPHGTRSAGELVEFIGREIVRRWLARTGPELWRHQGRDYYWMHLGRFAAYEPGSDSFEAGRWVARPEPRPDEDNSTTTTEERGQ
jgi:hypothetical protein